MMTVHRWHPLKKRLVSIILLLVIAFIGLQFIRPTISNPSVAGEIVAPAEVKIILKKACYDCHSNETQLKWFDKIVPAYWKVANHIKDGRAVLNFSEWNNLSPGEQKAKLWEAVNQTLTGTMPVKAYQLMHPAAKIYKSDLSILKAYVAGINTHNIIDSSINSGADKQYKQWSSQETRDSVLTKSINGIRFIPDYRNWQPVSYTERFDNGTIRAILGNDIAINALRRNRIHPWPNGTIFAKVAWTQAKNNNGEIHTGEFKQVEFMIKDDKRYASTVGWGWARFKTSRMVPYGKDVLFTNECVNCHKPMRHNDFVFTSPIKY